MVKYFLKLLFVLLPLYSFSQVQVKATIYDELASEGQALEGKLVIAHDKNMDIDEASIQLKGQALSVKLENQSSQSSVSIINGKVSEHYLLISTYTFAYPAQERGLHVLPEIKVKVGGKEYSSEKTTFEVYGTVASPNLRLDAFIQSPSHIYPGQSLEFIYRISYRRDLEVTHQEMPLMEAEGFRKIGEKEIRQYRKGGFQVQEVIQKVEALKPGTYSFKPAILEGFFYLEDFFGHRRYEKPKLKASSEALSVTIDSFPISGQPKSFNGAIGEFTFDVNYTNSKPVKVGDKFEIELVISGSGDLSTIKPPELSKQDGFKEGFRFSDLPAPAKYKGLSKLFKVELRPLTATIHEIPPIEFSFFEPNQGKYITLISEALPIEVEPFLSQELLEAPVRHTVEEQESIPTVSKPLVKEIEEPLLLGPIETLGNIHLQNKSLKYVPPLDPRVLLLLIPFVILLLLIQIFLQKKQVSRRSRKEIETSKKVFDKALLAAHDDGFNYHLLERAFMLLLKEKGLISTKVVTLSRLPNKDEFEPLKELFLAFEVWRFNQEESSSLHPLIQRAKDLFYRFKEL